MDKNYLISNGINVDASLELFGDIETYNETLKEYLNGVGEKVSNLNKYKEMSDTYNYAIVAHSLKSDSKYLGFTTLAELCYEHEMAGKNNDITSIYNTYDKLMEEINRVNKVVNEYFGNEVTPVVKEETNEVVSDKIILVVDDSDIITGYIKKIFDNQYAVKVAGDGEVAINTIDNDAEHKIVGMLLDLNLPKVSGFDVLEHLKEKNLFGQIPVTVITGSDSTDDIQKVFSYPIVDVLNKPFNERNLKDALDKMLKF